MSHNLKLATRAVDTEADALGAEFNDGYLRIYSGSQPATADTAIGGQVLLAELRFNATAFGSAAAGVITANGLFPEKAAKAKGRALWFRVFKADGTTPLMDGTVGKKGSVCDIELSSVDIEIGAEVSLGTFVHTVTR